MAGELFERSDELTLCLPGMGQERCEIIIRTFRNDICVSRDTYRRAIPWRDTISAEKQDMFGEIIESFIYQLVRYIIHA